MRPVVARTSRAELGLAEGGTEGKIVGLPHLAEGTLEDRAHARSPGTSTHTGPARNLDPRRGAAPGGRRPGGAKDSREPLCADPPGGGPASVPSATRTNERLAFVRSGQGEPLLLVHGGWEDHRAWEGILPLLSTGFEVIAVDRRGRGKTPAAGRDGSVRGDADDLARTLEESDLYPAHVAAHASASSAAMRLAVDRPDLVRSVLLHEPPFLSSLAADHDGRTAAEAVRSTLAQGQELIRSGKGDEAARQYLALFGSGREAWDGLEPLVRSRWKTNAASWARELDDPDVLAPDPAGFRDLAVPVLLTLGELSPVLAHRIVRALEGHLSNCTVRELPSSGHLPYLYAPSELVGTWASFLLERNVPPT